MTVGLTRCHGPGFDMAITGFMRVFFKKMGIENIRFKPAYNPYTEVRIYSHLGGIPLIRYRSHH